MNRDFSGLKPALVWKHFVAMCAIPHPSHHEEKIRAYVKGELERMGYACTEDEAHNLYARKEATPGMENRKGIVIQAHLDMVPQKNNDKVFDFEKDPIDCYIDGEWVTADGTTLGADNGIGAAAILAVMEDNTLVHGPVEALFTATEETGMDGAFGLKGGLLQGDILLNLDSETEGELYVGCAGGMDANIHFNYTEEAPAAGLKAVELTVKGLKGGHSGIQIVAQRANANKTLFRLLYKTEIPVQVASIDGGGLRNAIPREAVATVLVPADKVAAFMEEVKAFEQLIIKEYAGIEDEVQIFAHEVAMPEKCIPAALSEKLIRAVVACPDGAQKMSLAMPGLVQTSTNMARVVSDGQTIKIQCLLRSSVRSEKEALGDQIKAVFDLVGATTELSGSYDGWNPNMQSPILKAMRESYQALYGKEPAVTAIHAGLECGIIGSNYPNLDMISFGPTICYPHSPDEKVEIASVEKFFDFLTHTLKNAPVK